MNKLPEWVLNHKKKGTEIRFLSGRYYMYEVSSKWNPEKKRAQKITGKLLGKITQEKGFVASDKDTLRSKSINIQNVAVKEYGMSHLIQRITGNYIELLKNYFPKHWQTILALAYGRLLYQSALKNMAFHYSHSYLSEDYREVFLAPKDLGFALRELGENRPVITSFFSEFNKARGCVLFDGTDIVSCSDKMGINKLGKSKNGTYEQLINLMFVFSVEQQLPVYYRILPGNIKDVKSFRLCLDESGVKEAIIIADKGLYSEANVKYLSEEGLRFIIPLRRDSSLIDYGPNMQGGKKNFTSFFKFEGRFVWYYQINKGQGLVTIYLDEELKSREEKDFLNRIESCPEDYTIEKFHEKQYQFGTIALLSNADKAPKETYEDYKSRGEIETMIDAFKNIVEADHTYMQNEKALEGWMFINYIALHWYYRIYQLLRQNDLTSKHSPMDLIKQLTEIRKVKINGKWHNAEITKKTSDLITKIGIHIT